MISIIFRGKKTLHNNDDNRRVIYKKKKKTDLNVGQL